MTINFFNESLCINIKNSQIGFDGEIQKSYTIPTPHHLIRPGFLEVTVGGGINNLFTLANVSTQGLIMNRRYTLVEQVLLKASDGTEITVDCMLRPNSRDHIGGSAAVIDFTGPVGTADEGKAMAVQLSLDFNYDNGDITTNAVMIPAEDAELTYEFVGVKVALKFTAKGSDKGRTISHIDQEMTDLTIDPNEDFIISLTTEELQDYKSIFKIDLARTLSEAIDV